MWLILSGFVCLVLNEHFKRLAYLQKTLTDVKEQVRVLEAKIDELTEDQLT